VVEPGDDGHVVVERVDEEVESGLDDVDVSLPRGPLEQPSQLPGQQVLLLQQQQATTSSPIADSQESSQTANPDDHQEQDRNQREHQSHTQELQQDQHEMTLEQAVDFLNGSTGSDGIAPDQGGGEESPDARGEAVGGVEEGVHESQGPEEVGGGSGAPNTDPPVEPTPPLAEVTPRDEAVENARTDASVDHAGDPPKDEVDQRRGSTKAATTGGEGSEMEPDATAVITPAQGDVVEEPDTADLPADAEPSVSREHADGGVEQEEGGRPDGGVEQEEGGQPDGGVEQEEEGQPDGPGNQRGEPKERNQQGEAEGGEPGAEGHRQMTEQEQHAFNHEQLHLLVGEFACACPKPPHSRD
jgi:hypothetical protein